jgi:hypothetical protein
VTDGSVVEYKDKVVGFSQAKGVDLDVTLVSGFSKKERGDVLEVDASMAKGFEVHGRDTHKQKLLIVLACDVDLRDDGVSVMFPQIHRWSMFFGGSRFCEGILCCWIQ